MVDYSKSTNPDSIVGGGRIVLDINDFNWAGGTLSASIPGLYSKLRDAIINYKGYVICLPAQYEYAVVQYLRYDNGSSRSYICGRYIIEISYSLRTFQFYIYDDQVILEKISEETLLPH